MKKIVMMTLALVMAATMNAKDKDNRMVANYEISIDAYELNKYLGITDGQRSDRVGDICYLLNREVGDVLATRISDRPAKMVEVVYQNLRRMKGVLTPAEYHHYLVRLNQLLEQNNLQQFFD